MARSFTNAKLISAFVAEKVSVVATRRGYAAASSQGAMSSGVRGGGARGNMNVMLRKGGGEESANTATNSWVPDPVTGYYRPESHANEIDAAELRNMLLNHKH